MNLTPRQIQEKQFHDAFRGYSHEEVDGFLDSVAETFDHVYRENQTLHHRLKEMEVELTQAKGSEDMLKRMLVTAQETADKAVQEARAKGQSIEQQAASQSEAVIAAAEQKAQKIVTDAVAKERATQDAIEGATRFEREYRTRLRAFIESQLRVLDEGPVPAPSTPAPMQSPSTPAPVQTTSTPAPVQTTSTPAPVHKPSPASTTQAMPAVPVGVAAPAAPPAVEPTAPNARNIPIETATPPAAVIRLPQEVPAVAAPPKPRESAAAPPPAPLKEEGRSIDELFWGEE